MYKLKFSKLLLSLAPIILFSSFNLVNAENQNNGKDLLQQDKDNLHCKWDFNSCDNKFVAPITASILGITLTGIYFNSDNNIIKDVELKRNPIKFQYIDKPVNPNDVPFQAAISTIPVSIAVPSIVSLFSVPDPLFSSTVSKGLSSVPASSTGISSIPASGSYSSFNSSFFVRIPSDFSSTIPSSPIAFPSVFKFITAAFPKQDKNGRLITDYWFPATDYKTRLKDFEFNSVVTFGDSLSDTGSHGRNTIYMADAAAYNLYNSLLSQYYSGKPNAPDVKGGVNFAVSGAVITVEGKDFIDSQRTSQEDEIRWYLNDRGGKADPNSLYIYWIGGNDLASKLSVGVPQKIFDGIFSSNPQEKFRQIFDQNGFDDDKETISSIVKQVGTLLDADAGYVFFMNLPASGYAPFTQMFAEGATIGSVDLFIERFPLIVLSPSYWLSKIADDYLRDPANHIGDPKNRGREYIIENNVSALKHRYFFLPESWLRAYYNFAADIQNAFVRQFNNETKRQLSGINYKGNIIYADIDGIFSEVLEDFQSYGIDEVLVPQCQLGLQSTSCDAPDARFHDDKIYAFTDWHHPSEFSHLIIAQYMASIFDAPVFVSALTRNLENIDINRKDFIKGQLQDLRSNIYNTDKNIIPIVGYSGLNNKIQSSFVESKQDETNLLHVGLAYSYSPSVTLGFIGSFGFGKQNPHNEINFKQNNQSLTLFGQYIYDNYWINTNITGGIYKANDINRIIILGHGHKIEQGSTKGRSYNISLQTGYNFNIKDNLILSPNIGYSTSRYKINAYEENNNLSTSMRFGKQDSTSHIVFAGIELLTQSKPLNTSFEVNYNHRLNSKDLILDSVGIKSTDLTFSRKGMNYKNGKSNDWIDISPRINVKLSENIYLNTGIDYQFDLKGKKNNSRLNYNLGLRSSF